MSLALQAKSIHNAAEVQGEATRNEQPPVPPKPLFEFMVKENNVLRVPECAGKPVGETVGGN